MGKEIQSVKQKSIKHNKGTLLFVCSLFSRSGKYSCRAYMWGAYTRSKAYIKEKVGLSAGGAYTRGGACRRRNTAVPENAP